MCSYNRCIAGQKVQIVNRKALLLALAIACAACEGRRPEDEAPSAPSAQPNTPEPLPSNREASARAELGDRTAASENAIDPKSAQGAGQVLQLFGGLLEQRRFAQAYRLWSDDGRASGLSQAEFIASYDKYAEIHSEVGIPGNMEGAAGSSYVDIPFRLYGNTEGSEPFNLVGTVTLRRVNDVPGSSEEQRRWHIYKSDLEARP